MNLALRDDPKQQVYLSMTAVLTSAKNDRLKSMSINKSSIADEGKSMSAFETEDQSKIGIPVT